MTHIIAEIAQNKHNTKGGVKKGGVHFFENVDPPPTDIIQIFENIVSPSTLILPPKIIENIVQ